MNSKDYERHLLAKEAERGGSIRRNRLLRGGQGMKLKTKIFII